MGYWGRAIYAKAMSKRQVWVKPMFAEAKEWHHLWRCASSSSGEGQHRSPADRVWTEPQALTQSTEVETSTLARRRG